MIACHSIACCTVCAKVAMQALSAVAAITHASTSSATPGKPPQSAPRISVVAAASTAVLRTPSAMHVSSLAKTIDRRETDAASRRASVPWLRSSMMLKKPN